MSDLIVSAFTDAPHDLEPARREAALDAFFCKRNYVYLQPLTYAAPAIVTDERVYLDLIECTALFEWFTACVVTPQDVPHHIVAGDASAAANV